MCEARKSDTNCSYRSIRYNGTNKMPCSSFSSCMQTSREISSWGQTRSRLHQREGIFCRLTSIESNILNYEIMWQSRNSIALTRNNAMIECLNLKLSPKSHTMRKHCMRPPCQPGARGGPPPISLRTSPEKKTKHQLACAAARFMYFRRFPPI